MESNNDNNNVFIEYIWYVLNLFYVFLLGIIIHGRVLRLVSFF